MSISRLFSPLLLARFLLAGLADLFGDERHALAQCFNKHQTGILRMVSFKFYKDLGSTMQKEVMKHLRNVKSSNEKVNLKTTSC